jgi:hypothetical protein
MKKFLIIGFIQASLTFSQIPFDFKGKAVLELNCTELSDSIYVEVYAQNFFADQQIEFFNKEIKSPGKYFLSCNCHSPEKIRTSINNQNLVMFASPSDTIHATFSYKDKTKWSIKYDGKNAAENQYYLQKRNHFSGMDMEFYKIRLAELSEPKRYYTMIDSFSNLEQKFLAEYASKNNLQKKFTDYESTEIKYSNAYFKLGYPAFHRNPQKKYTEEIINYIPIEPSYDSSALLNYSYYQYLDFAISISLSIDSVLLKSAGEEGRFIRQAKVLNQAQSILYGEVADVFLANSLHSTMNSRDEKFFNRIMNDEKIKFNNSAYKDFLLKEYNEKFILKPGDAASVFYSKDKKEKIIPLKNYFGKPLYVCFWRELTPETKQEFLYQKKLAEQNQIIVINVADDINFEQWKKAISADTDKKIQQLILFGNWNELVVDDYDIKSFPHIVLIDKTGKIIENAISRKDKNHVEELINKIK